MVTSFPSAFEKVGETVAQVLDGSQPRPEKGVALGRQGVGALRGAWKIRLPLGRDEPLVLERPQRPVQVPDVDAILAGQLGEPLEQLVAVGRPRRERDEESSFAEALDPRANLPLTGLGS
jgi:hypothetical protein